MREVTTPLGAEVEAWQAGERILLSGIIYTARDAAHLRMAQTGEMPVDWLGQAVYYAGPSPAPPGRPIGAVGPTTSSRMDAFAPLLIAKGLRAMIGKGERAEAIWRLKVEKMPLVVAIDCQGRSLYELEPPKYRQGGSKCSV